MGDMTVDALEASFVGSPSGVWRYHASLAVRGSTVSCAAARASR
jgi:hypothetical protein